MVESFNWKRRTVWLKPTVKGHKMRRPSEQSYGYRSTAKRGEQHSSGFSHWRQKRRRRHQRYDQKYLKAHQIRHPQIVISEGSAAVRWIHHDD